ncbi:MAG: hypothetical protein JNK78_01245 [Planctomycetes bacterium]|nr:hypothetical protein [Planctomycetota bacterium]
MTALPDHPPRPHGRIVHGIVLLALVAVTIVGACKLAFLCDDAYIHFRYAANAHAGHGLVWNPEPFRPVEGMSFLWVVALWTIWAWTGAEPPDATIPFSIVCGVVQLLVIAAAAHRIRRTNGSRVPAAIAWITVAAVVSNRTFLQWMSSGLDTPFFNVFALSWVLHGCRAPANRSGRWLAVWAALAACASMIRPDGLPMVCATAAVAVADAMRRLRSWSSLLGLAPLLATGAFFLWRHSYYGEWLPNTYYAKVATPWPEAGVRYFACFAFENGTWLLVPIVVAWVLSELRRGVRRATAGLLDHLPGAAAVVIAAFNASYYCLVVGGDHFEYRVLCQLVPLCTLAAVAMVVRIANGAAWPIATSLAFALAGCVSWGHLALTRDPSHYGIQAVSPQLPRFVQPITRWFDRQQAWLFTRYIGLRTVHHDLLLRAYQETSYPRRLTMPALPDPFPILATGAVGLPSWCLPDCAIFDDFGLNDWVVARTPRTFGEPMTEARMRPAVEAADRDHDGFLDKLELGVAIETATGGNKDARPGEFVFNYLITVFAEHRPDAVTLDEAVAMSSVINTGRMMAHERQPTQEYRDAFEPNVTVAAGVVTVTPRREPMTAERIRAIESEWREKILAARRP